MTRKAWAKGPNAPKRLSGRRAVECRKRWLELHPLCLHCEKAGRVRLAEEVDHVVPLARGGADHESNFQSLCKPHHLVKTTTEMGGTLRPRTGLDGWPVENETSGGPA